jgi:glycerol-3-phosphate O-acyltransferase
MSAQSNAVLEPLRSALVPAYLDETATAEAAVDRVVSSYLARTGGEAAVEEAIATTLYHEGRRLEQSDGSERDDLDRAFYARMTAELRDADATSLARLLRTIVARYGGEIQGHFDRRVYAFATRALPMLLTALLHGIAPSRMLARVGQLGNIDDHVLPGGELERLRDLARQGTVLLAPSHSSNLDSLVVGYAIYRMGLPPFAYGAGLNLLSNPIEGFFMRHLGAYTVDRRKSDPIYRDVLKEYATVSLEHGQHQLFFPGGTRSRSGALETRLKKGLLGTAVTAFGRTLSAGRPDARFYVVPCTLTYPLVLEAESLIGDHLRDAGKASLVLPGDEFLTVRRWADFLRGLMELSVHVHVTIGAPLDPMGNDVDERGGSRDARGRPIDPRRYLMTRGAVTVDPERDAAFTDGLAERVLCAYRRDNVVLPTSVVAFAAFEQLRARSRHTSLHRMLREAAVSARALPVSDLVATIERLIGEIRAIADRGAIRLGPDVRSSSPEALLDDALRVFATYHRLPVLARGPGGIVVGDARLLLYYRNRLDGYGLFGAQSLAGPS